MPNCCKTSHIGKANPNLTLLQIKYVVAYRLLSSSSQSSVAVSLDRRSIAVASAKFHSNVPSLRASEFVSFNTDTCYVGEGSKGSERIHLECEVTQLLARSSLSSAKKKKPKFTSQPRPTPRHAPIDLTLARLAYK